MIKFQHGQVVRFTYNYPPEYATDPRHKEDWLGGQGRYKEVLVLHPGWRGRVHAIDLKRLTAAERGVVAAIFDPDPPKDRAGRRKQHRFPLVNDILRRMQPIDEVKNPQRFYVKFVKVFLKDKDAYRQYEPARMLSVTVVKYAEFAPGIGQSYGKPLFHGVESKPKPVSAKPPAAPKPPAQPKAPAGAADRLALLKARAAAMKKG